MAGAGGTTGAPQVPVDGRPESQTIPRQGSAGTMVIKELGQTVRKLRQARRMSTAWLGHLAGIAPGRVWAVENGYVNVRSAELLRLAEALSVRPIHFFEPENMPGDPEADGAWECLRRK
jgi:hypothetical protein